MQNAELAAYAKESIRIGHVRFRRQCAAHHIPSEEAHVFRLDFDGARPDIVVKAERPGSCKVAREAVLFPHLSQWDIPIPRLESTHADMPNAPFSFLLMDFVPGAHLETFPAAETEFGESFFHRLGSMIARINAIPLDQVPTDFAVTPYVSQWQTAAVAHARRVLYDQPGCEGILADVEKVWSTSPSSFCHCQGVQVLTDGATLAIVDWGNAGAAPRMRDLAYFCFDFGVAFGSDPGALWRRWVLKGYASTHPLSPEEEDELRILESYAALDAAIKVPGRRSAWLTLALACHASKR